MSLTDEFQYELPIVDVGIHRTRAEQLRAACRSVAIARGYARCAADLDGIFEPLGRPVSLGTLHNTLGDHERHYARSEWVPYFASYSEDVAEIVASSAGRVLAPVGKLKLKPEDELELTRDLVLREFGIAGARLLNSISGGRRGR